MTTQQFTQKYAIIQLFEDVEDGYEFSSDSWPLHSTLADTFAIEWDVPTMVTQLSSLLSQHSTAVSTAKDDELFGADGQVRVVLLEKTDSLDQLHRDVINLLKLGGWKPNDPQFAEDGFLPHATVQKHARLDKGDSVTFNSLSIVDFLPGGDPYQRKILATINIAR